MSLKHRGEEIVKSHPAGTTTVWRLASGGPKMVIGHPFGHYVGHDTRKAVDEKVTDAEMGKGAYARGVRMYAEEAVEQFFDSYSDKRSVTQDAFHQALDWLVSP